MKEHLRHRFAEAAKLRASGDLAGAKLILSDLSKEDPKSTAILAVLGHVCWDMGLLLEAQTTFERATKLSPKLEAVSLGLFHCLWESGKREEALEETKRFMSVSDSENYREIVREINKQCQ